MCFFNEKIRQTLYDRSVRVVGGGKVHQITSTNNQRVKDWKKLQTRKGREKSRSYLIEGFHLVEEALDFKKNDILEIIVRDDIVDTNDFIHLSVDKERLTVVSKEIAADISDMETNQGIFAEVELNKESTPNTINGPFLLLDAVQDPGNVGTMIRTADAAGFQGVFLGKGTVDLYNPKTIRSTQGSHFHLDIYEGKIEEFILNFNDSNYLVLGTALNEEAVSYKEVAVDSPFALIVGNEGAGIRPEILQTTDQNIYIPIKGQAESLNVAIAASILMFYLN